MSGISIDQIKQLREETGLSVGECKKALENAQGDMARAKELLREWGDRVVEKKRERQTTQGLIESYVHSNGKIGVLLEVHCETDFVSMSLDFKNLCHALALQIVSMGAESVDELLSQEYIKDPQKNMRGLLTEAIAKLGENIVVERFSRFQI